MVDYTPGVDIREGFERHAMAILFQVDPSGEGLLHHPAAQFRSLFIGGAGLHELCGQEQP